MRFLGSNATRKIHRDRMVTADWSATMNDQSAAASRHLYNLAGVIRRSTCSPVRILRSTYAVPGTQTLVSIPAYARNCFALVMGTLSSSRESGFTGNAPYGAAAYLNEDALGHGITLPRPDTTATLNPITSR